MTPTLPNCETACRRRGPPFFPPLPSRELARIVLAWIPLLHGGGKSGTIARWLRLAEQEPDQQRRADYAGLALTMASVDAFQQLVQAVTPPPGQN
jgi:hypothetical protein